MSAQGAEDVYAVALERFMARPFSLCRLLALLRATRGIS